MRRYVDLTAITHSTHRVGVFWLFILIRVGFYPFYHIKDQVNQLGRKMDCAPVFLRETR